MEWNILAGTTYAIIGARSGSKNIPQKNIRPVGGFPLIAYSIVAGILTKGVKRTIVSTDLEEIAAVAKTFGADVPFLRPAELASDNAVDRDFIVHALEWLQKNEGGVPELLVFLRPTSPLRNPDSLTEAIRALNDSRDATGLRSAHKSDCVPQKMFGKNGKFFVGLFPADTRIEYHGLPRQSFPASYKADGYVDVLRSKTLLDSPESTYGENILAFETPDTGDIDSMSDIEYVERMLQQHHWDIYEYLKKHHS
ncbi:acylneuraminate cytidylyltransferase family protein [Candidatus Peregrinibacteria bacterium]|nr:acylneuraminate cytidylyltransferase family protein [Candidatus Peregrinibacteria bacterium]